MESKEISIELPRQQGSISGDLTLPSDPSKALGICVFAHGSGSSRHSPRNRLVAKVLQDQGIGTLLMDLLTLNEERVDEFTREHRFDIQLLTSRVVAAIDYFSGLGEEYASLPMATFGASTGAAAALWAANLRKEKVNCVVSRGGRPDLVPEKVLQEIEAPTLFILGGYDYEVIQLNQQAYRALSSRDKRFEIVPGETHLFEEPGTLNTAAQHAAEFMKQQLSRVRKEE